MNSYNSLDLRDSCHFIQEDHLMNARQKLHQIHLQEWTVRFADQKASGLTVRQWCEQNNLSFHTYNYWKHLLKEEVVEQALPDIVPLSLPVLSDSSSSLETTVHDVLLSPQVRSRLYLSLPDRYHKFPTLFPGQRFLLPPIRFSQKIL